MQVAIQAWNALGGIIDWAGLPIVAEMIGITDIERLIKHLILIRDFKHDQA